MTTIMSKQTRKMQKLLRDFCWLVDNHCFEGALRNHSEEVVSNPKLNVGIESRIMRIENKIKLNDEIISAKNHTIQSLLKRLEERSANPPDKHLEEEIYVESDDETELDIKEDHLISNERKSIEPIFETQIVRIENEIKHSDGIISAKKHTIQSLIKSLGNTEHWKHHLEDEIFDEIVCDEQKSTLNIQEDHSTINERKSIEPICELKSLDLKVKGAEKVNVRHQCLVCRKKFQSRSQLLLHMRIHEGKTSYKCTECKYSATTKQHLTFHMNRAHVSNHDQSKVTLRQCTVCNKDFSNQRDLKMHMHIHNEEDRYKCGMCIVSFAHNDDLDRHFSSVHSNQKDKLSKEKVEKSYECLVCSKKFQYRSILLAHTRVHEGVTRFEFQCTKCVYAFTTKRRRNAHMTTIHGKKHGNDKSLEERS